MRNPRSPWPFTARTEELDLVRRSLAAGRRGVVVTGAAGVGRSRLAAEAVPVPLPVLVTEAVTEPVHARVAGTPDTLDTPFAAFAHLLSRLPLGAGPSTSPSLTGSSPHPTGLLCPPDPIEALDGVRVLVVDDAHLLDDSSAALVRRLALRGRTRLLVTVREGVPVPEDVSRLWKEDLLPRVTLAAMTERECGELLSRAVGGYVDTLTVRRLHRASRGDLRLLRELVVAVHAGGDLSNVSGTWTWRGTPPMTARVRELVEDTIRDVDGEEREALELIASGRPLRLVMSGEPAEPTSSGEPPKPTASGTSSGSAVSGTLPGLPVSGDPPTPGTPTSGAPGAGTAFGVLERLRTKGLVTVDDRLSVRLAHPLHGPVLRAAAKRPGAGGPSGAPRLPGATATALADECEELAVRAYAGHLSGIPRGAGERMAEDDTGWDEPAMPEFCARRARVARLRGETREAVAWSREGLRRSPHHHGCLAELAHASAYIGDLTTARQALSRGPALGEDARTRGRPASRARPPASPISPAPPEATADARSWALAAERARTWTLAAEGDLDGALRSALRAAGDTPLRDDPHGDDLFALHDVVRLGTPELVVDRLGRLAERAEGDLAPLLARHARALARRDGEALDKVARGLTDLGLLLHAAEAFAHAALVHEDRRASQASRNRASALAGACQGARSSALVNLALPRLTARQRQIVSLAAAGLTNRQIAEQLTVSIRTVANHLCDAYARLGSSDRAGLGRLFTVG
ncbi:LuxR C-terminal-related transcriptional regulator [Streptosporangium sp. NPDC002721]|uniref:LuxR C-terminal-related transcriptional regulator n=1 Tax=Streptosporangium sp. NPDC002721 TaxID=3366188 RepID=UPI0036AAA72C